jgi:predicted hydrolase (HD superfamily)
MKTSNRVRKNSSAAPAARQVKTLPEKTVTVVFCSLDGDKELFRVDFQEKFFAAIKRGAKTLGVSLDKFFEQAMECAIEASEDPAATTVKAGGR